MMQIKKWKNYLEIEVQSMLLNVLHVNTFPLRRRITLKDEKSKTPSEDMRLSFRVKDMIDFVARIRNTSNEEILKQLRAQDSTVIASLQQLKY